MSFVSWRRACAALTLAVAAPATAMASGYAIYEQGAAALGRGGAVTASIGDASAVFYNPANLVWFEGAQGSVHPTFLSPGTSFAGWNPYPGYGVVEEMQTRTFITMPSYYGRPLGERWGVGVGVAFPFGLGVEWRNPETFTGRYIVTKAELTSVQALANLAYKIGDDWSVAAGPNLAWSKVELQNRQLATIPGRGGAQTDVAKTSLTSDFKPGAGFHLATAWRINDAWKWGATYRSKIVTPIEGDAEFDQILTGNATFDAGVAAQLPPDQPVKTVVRFPALWSTGFAWTPNERWTIEADLNLYEWSVFSDLPLHFQTTPQASTTIEENYDDAFQIRVGAEHRLERWTYRMGYYYDEAAAPDESVSPLLPDSGRNGASFGLGLPLGSGGRWTLDLYELAVFVQHRSTLGVNRDGFNGDYKSFVNAAGFSLNYRWGQGKEAAR